MGNHICCSDTNKNNESIIVYKYILLLYNIILQLSVNPESNRGKNSISTINFKNKRTSSLETCFKSQNINDISAQIILNKNCNKKNIANDSKSLFDYKIKANVSK